MSEIKPRCWVSINSQGDVTHPNDSQMPWSPHPLYDASALSAKDAEIAHLKRQHALDLLAASNREIDLQAEIADMRKTICEQQDEIEALRDRENALCEACEKYDRCLELIRAIEAIDEMSNK